MSQIDPIAAATQLALADLRQHQLNEQALVIPAEGTVTEAPAPSTPVDGEGAAVAAVAPTTEEASAPAAPSPVEPAKTETPQEPDYVPIIHEGVEVKLTKAELVELARKGFDYTKKTQAVADLRKEAEEAKAEAANKAKAQVEEVQTRIAHFLRDPGALRAQLELLESGALTPFAGSVTDGEMASPSTGHVSVSKEEIAQLIKEEQGRFKDDLATQAQSVMAQMEMAQTQKQMQEQIDAAVKSAVEANPLLASLKDPKKVIFAEVHPWVRDRIVADPEKEVGVAAVIEKINEVARGYAQGLEKTVREEAQKLVKTTAQGKIQEAITHSQNLAAQGGVGPGGAVAVGAPKSTSGMRVGDPRLRAMVEEDLRSAESAHR